MSDLRLIPPHQRRRMASVCMYAAAQAAGTWTNMAASEAFFIDKNQNRTSVRFNTNGFTHCRLVVKKTGTAGNSGAKVYAKYHTSHSNTVGDYSALGVSSVEVAIDTTDDCLDSGWIRLAPGARGDIYLTLTGDGGDGATDPQFGNAHIEFKR